MTLDEFKAIDLKEVENKVEKIMHRNGYRNFYVDFIACNGEPQENFTVNSAVYIQFYNKEESGFGFVYGDEFIDNDVTKTEFIEYILISVFEYLIDIVPSLKKIKEKVERNEYNNGAFGRYDYAAEIVKLLRK